MPQKTGSSARIYERYSDCEGQRRSRIEREATARSSIKPLLTSTHVEWRQEQRDFRAKALLLASPRRFASPQIDSRSPPFSNPWKRFITERLPFAIWQELGGEKADDVEAVYHTLATLLSRWLLARSEYPEMEAIKLFAKVWAYVPQPERFFVTGPLNNRYAPHLS